MGRQGGGPPQCPPAHHGHRRLTLGLAGRIEEANAYKARIRERVPDYAMADFLAAFRFSPDAAAVFKQGGQRIGIV